MFNFAIDTLVLNGLLKRLSGVASGDPAASITFLLEASKLKVFYESKIEKTDIPCIFVEDVPVISSEGEGNSTILVKELSSINVSEFKKEDKFPYTRRVSFKFSKSILHTSWEVFYSESKSTQLRLAHAILEIGKDVSTFSKLMKDRENFVEISTEKIHQAIINCNLFKADATSRDGNGCLLEIVGQDFVLVGTDSIMASKFQSPVIKHTLDKHFRVVLSNVILALIKNFTNGTESIKISASRSSLYVETSQRGMKVPTLNTLYGINDPNAFFNLDENSQHIGSIDLPPIPSIVSTLTHLSNDVHNKVYLQFKEGSFNIRTDKNSSEGLPSTIRCDSEVKINGSLFTTSIQKLSSIEKMSEFYFNSSNNRVTLCSPNRELIFLIQGMN